MLRNFWHDFVLPLVRRPALLQAAALCWRDGPHGPEVLLITSRDTGRWVVPKGWPKKGLDTAGTARDEAWEEAGVIARMARRPLGTFHYDKRMNTGVPLRVTCELFALKVDRLSDDFPEKDERVREWMTLSAAAAAVKEPQLAALIRGFDPKAHDMTSPEDG